MPLCQRARHCSTLRAGAALAVLPQEARFTRTFWMSMPAKGKHLARMQTVWRFLKETGVGEAKQLVSDGKANVSRM